jgi:magnesium transporter
MIRIFAPVTTGQSETANRALVTARRDPSIETEPLDQWAARYLPKEPSDRAVWIDIQNPSTEDLAWLGRAFRFHPLALEDCAHFDQRAKVEEYPNHLFVVVHALKACPESEIGLSELHCFLEKNVVVTVHEEPIPALQSLMDRIERDPAQLPNQSDFLLHRLLDWVMDANPRFLDRIEESLGVLEEKPFDRLDQAHLDAIRAMRKQISQVRRALGPQREIYYIFAKGGYPGISTAAAVYFRDIYDHSARILEFADELREGAASLHEGYLALSAVRTNETVKRLTIFNALFLPLTFITGFFGMNFEAIGWSSQPLFIGALASMALVPLVLLAWFRTQQWTE